MAVPEERIAPYLTSAQTFRRSSAKEGVTEGEDVRALQEDLRHFGVDFGAIDGVYGAGTQAAVVCFQIETYDHVVDGRLPVDQVADPDVEAPTQEAWIEEWAIDGIVGDGTRRAIRAWIEAGLTAEILLIWRSTMRVVGSNSTSDPSPSSRPLQIHD